MGNRFLHNVLRASRFWAGVPPDAGTYLLAVLENPHGIAAAVFFALDTLGGELLKVYAVAILVRCLWPRLPSGVQRALLKVRDFFWPWAKPRDRDHEIEELEARVRNLERLLRSPPALHADDSDDSTETPDGKRTES